MRFPQLSVYQLWPTGRPVFVTVPLAGLIAGIAATIFGWAVVVIFRWGSEPLVVSIGAVGLAVASIGILAMALGMLREVVPKPSIVFGYPVSRCSDADRGQGVRVSHPTRLIILVPTLVGLIVFGQSCWWAQWAGVGESFPFSSVDDGWATVALAASIVLFVGLVLVVLTARWRIYFELYPSGIVRRNPLPDLREKDRFVSWDDIAGVDSRTQYIATYLREGPTIVLRLTDSTAPVTNGLFDKVGEFGIPAYLARCDSNVLFAIIELLVEDPGARRLLAAKGVGEWFTTHHHASAQHQRFAVEPLAFSFVGPSPRMPLHFESSQSGAQAEELDDAQVAQYRLPN